MTVRRCVCDDLIALITEGALAGKFDLHRDDQMNDSCWGSFTWPDGEPRTEIPA